MMPMDTVREYLLWNDFLRVCGIDEAGRGPLAGPVVAAAVVFPRWFSPDEGILRRLNDSKKLTPSLRRELAPAIREEAECWAVEAVDHETIDRINILRATMLAMNRAAESLPRQPDLLLIDGNRFTPNIPVPYQTIVGGDALVFSIAAASVLAKTERDRMMEEYAERYPEYGFERNAGYGTREHVEAIRRHGRSPIHRTSFRLRQLGEK
ncbi:RNase HII [Pelodictyon luteolum DSM 273]|uniref:Ribonuclease HII n=2 Tax=Pelodictyon luteolum TaxID=1100 RepID=RNH2_CHLL3|nr:RecName: Full=Ribonuclease HII; Short=RNase HII [Pelodictyon luteolum DSM 273]ABB22903.1 RNase HII [Pelodictyon luteolum DSM 273]